MKLIEITVLLTGIINLLFTISWYIYTHNMYLERLEIYETKIKELSYNITTKEKEDKYDKFKNEQGLFLTRR